MNVEYMCVISMYMYVGDMYVCSLCVYMCMGVYVCL